MRKTIAAVAGAGILTAASALLTPAVGSAYPADLGTAVCNTYRAEVQGLTIAGSSRPIVIRMVVAAGTPRANANTALQYIVSSYCPEFSDMV